SKGRVFCRWHDRGVDLNSLKDTSIKGDIENLHHALQADCQKRGRDSEGAERWQYSRRERKKSRKRAPDNRQADRCSERRTCLVPGLREKGRERIRGPERDSAQRRRISASRALARRQAEH